MINKESQYDFTMCNPPFFLDSDEALGVKNTRNVEKRPDAKSVSAGKQCELIYDEGGEVDFVKKIINDSIKIGKRIK